MSEDARSKILRLIELALHEKTPPHEASAAAMAACRKIRAERVLSELLQSEGGLVGVEDVVIVVIPFLILNQSSTMLRVSRLEPPKKHSSHVMLIPKEYVRKTVMMTLEESKAIGWKGSQVIKSLTLVRSYFETARQSGWDDWA